jgi:hypothetical protein
MRDKLNSSHRDNQQTGAAGHAQFGMELQILYHAFFAFAVTDIVTLIFEIIFYSLKVHQT